MSKKTKKILEVAKPIVETTQQKKRQIIIETDGFTIQIKLLEISGYFEAKAIFDSVLSYIAELPNSSKSKNNNV